MSFPSSFSTKRLEGAYMAGQSDCNTCVMEGGRQECAAAHSYTGVDKAECTSTRECADKGCQRGR